MGRSSNAYDTAPDLFGPARQADLFGEAATPVDYRPKPEHIRMKMTALLSKARAAKTMPWDETQARYWQTVFPQMANWLPDEEARQLRLDFAAELERLKGG